MTVGEKLQEIMDWRGLRQSKVASLSGVSATMISEYIRGDSEPTVSTLLKLADGLDITAWALINGEPLAVKDLELNESERRMIAQYRTLTSRGRKLIENTITGVCELERRGEK